MEISKYTGHFGLTFKLAYPVMLSQLGQVMVGVIDNVMVGRLGAETLAAASLANSIFFLVMMFGIGISMAITPLVAVAEGEGKKRKITKLFNHGFVINLLTGVVLFVFVLGFSPGIHYLGQPEEVVILAIPYLLIITFSLVPLMFFQTFKQFVEGLSQTRQAMVITLVCNVINVFLNWVLIYGELGFPALGLNGAGWATLISRVLMGGIIYFYVKRSKRYTAYRTPLVFKNLSRAVIGRMLKIGVPTGFQFVFEVGAFSTAAIMMGWMGVHALAAHQIAINLASISYMMASGLSAAAMVRVGNQLGRRDITTLREVAFSIFGMVVMFMSFFAVLFVVFRNHLPLIYLDDIGVVNTAATLLIIAGIFQLSDGLQVVGLGALRGLSDLKVPTLVTLIAYWVVGLPLGYVLAFVFDLREIGVWIGLLTGLTATAILLIYRFDRLTKRMLKTQHQPSRETAP